MNFFSILVFATLMVSAVNCVSVNPETWRGDWGGSTVLSKRDTPTVEKVLKTINTTIEQAYDGIDSRVLYQAMKTIIADVDQLTAGQKVDVKAVNALILEVFETLDTDSTATPFDGPFWSQRKALSVTLTLLQELAKKTEELEESGESVVSALEAISKTAESIRDIDMETELLIENAYKQGKDVAKRSRRRRF